MKAGTHGTVSIHVTRASSGRRVQTTRKVCSVRHRHDHGRSRRPASRVHADSRVGRGLGPASSVQSRHWRHGTHGHWHRASETAGGSHGPRPHACWAGWIFFTTLNRTGKHIAGLQLESSNAAGLKLLQGFVAHSYYTSFRFLSYT